MALIENSNPKKSSGNYNKIIDNPTIVSLMGQVQSTTIKIGFELEKIIENEISNSKKIFDLNEFLIKYKENKIKNSTYCATKEVIKSSGLLDKKNEPDFLIINVKNNNITFNIIELKSGCDFDTKKSSGELSTLTNCKNQLERKIQIDNTIVTYFVCCFNEKDKDSIVSGFKNRFKEENVLTGIEFCEKLGIDYNEIIKKLQNDKEENTNYAIDILSNDLDIQKKSLEKYFNLDNNYKNNRTREILNTIDIQGYDYDYNVEPDVYEDENVKILGKQLKGGRFILCKYGTRCNIEKDCYGDNLFTHSRIDELIKVSQELVELGIIDKNGILQKDLVFRSRTEAYNFVHRYRSTVPPLKTKLCA